MRFSSQATNPSAKYPRFQVIELTLHAELNSNPFGAKAASVCIVQSPVKRRSRSITGVFFLVNQQFLSEYHRATSYYFYPKYPIRTFLYVHRFGSIEPRTRPLNLSVRCRRKVTDNDNNDGWGELTPPVTANICTYT
jgi:hypothetical protein